MKGNLLHFDNSLINGRHSTMQKPRSIRAAIFLGAALLWLTGCGDDAPDATMAAESKGRSERRLITSASMPSPASASAARDVCYAQ